MPLRYDYGYDGEGRLNLMRDPLGTETILTYDERGLILTRVEGAGSADEAMYRYTYDLNGNQLRVTDPADHQVTYDYDAWDRLVRTELPGQPAAERTTIAFSIDELDHCTRITIDGLLQPGDVGTLFDARTDYDQRGRPWRRRLGASVSTVTYDADERAVATEDQRGGRLLLGRGRPEPGCGSDRPRREMSSCGPTTPQVRW